MYIVNIFDPKEWDIWFACGSAYRTYPKPVKTAKQFCIEQKADLCFNLALFNFSGHETVNYVRTRDFGEVGYGGTSETVEIAWTDKCSGYAVAIKDNSARLPNKTWLGGYSKRNGIGMTPDGKIIIAQSTNNVSESAFAAAVLKEVRKRGEGVKLFLFEDGGGSVQEFSSISRINSIGTRAIATVTCLKRKALSKVTRTLTKGSRGEDVRLLQTVLGGVECDGIFGNGTRSQLRIAQKNLGLVADGSCGPLTQKALGLR